jgi:hypothetical protein
MVLNIASIAGLLPACPAGVAIVESAAILIGKDSVCWRFNVK